MKIDLVIPYVDNENIDWQNNFNKYSVLGFTQFFRTGENALRYLLRSVEKNLPFINKVFLLVQNRSEVPSYVDTQKVCVVTHEDFIPKEYLPTFNASTIELFIYRIPNLSEKFIFTNDDIFICNELNEKTFFVDDKAITSFNNLYFKGNQLSYFEHVLLNDNELIFGKSKKEIRQNGFVTRPHHTLRPYFKSIYEECLVKYKDMVEKSITRLRTPFNYNSYIVDLYQKEIGKCLDMETVKNVGIYNNISNDALKQVLTQRADTICIVDKFSEVDIFQNIVLREFFDKRFDKVSKYEKT